MSGISFNPPVNDDQEPAPPPAADDVTLDGFWPALNITAIREAIRLDTNITAGRLRESTRIAMLHVADQLSDWRAEQAAAGHANLQAVPPRQLVGGQSDYVALWNRAVYSAVGADLGERQVGGGLTTAGAERAEQLMADVEIHRRNLSFAVRDFLGRPRVIAEAI